MIAINWYGRRDRPAESSNVIKQQIHHLGDPGAFEHILEALGCLWSCHKDSTVSPRKRRASRVSFDLDVQPTTIVDYECDNEATLKKQCWQSIAETDEVKQAMQRRDAVLLSRVRAEVVAKRVPLVGLR